MVARTVARLLGAALIVAAAVMVMAACDSSSTPARSAVALAVLGGETDSFATSGNGGATWSVFNAPAGQATLEAMAFDGAGGGWVVGSGVILRTADGGANWRIEHIRGDFISVAADAASHTVLVGGTVDGRAGILRSTDGGATWRRVTIPRSSVQWVNSLALADARHGWALVDDMVLYTEDGGLTWRRQLHPAARQLMEVRCAGPEHAWAVGQSPAGGPLILATKDGGAHWTVQYDRVANHSPLGDAAFVDDTHGWAVGRGLLLSTTDAGRHWSTRQVRVDGHRTGVLSVAFADAEHGWMATGSRPLLVTSDGGRTWRSQYALDLQEQVSVVASEAGGGK